MQLGNGIYYSTVPTQTWLRAITTCVCKPETVNTVGAPDHERRIARNMLSFLMYRGIINSVTKLHLVGYSYWVYAIVSDIGHGRSFYELMFPFLLWRFDSFLGLDLLLGGFAIMLTAHITPGRTPLDEWSARSRDPYLKIHNTHNRQTSMPPTLFIVCTTWWWPVRGRNI